MRPTAAASRTAWSRRPRSAEEAVVDKEARVREEVVLRKTAEARTETVRDSVRHTEVEIEDDRARAASPRPPRPRRPRRTATRSARTDGGRARMPGRLDLLWKLHATAVSRFILASNPPQCRAPPCPPPRRE
ncbi:DUF2382 domain-containing protein [Dankookia sp. P2]|uniref:DUF2382 domain-containing protein n=1 Tax=Dankookia sp. P2 TaxID=3423955 RepID=UPI003D66A19A